MKSAVIVFPGSNCDRDLAVAFDAANGASAAIQAWVTAFEALASAPDDEAENVVVTGMCYVGRNT